MSRIDPRLLEAARYASVEEIATRYADLDPNDHVNNVAMVGVIEDARVRFSVATGYRELGKPGWPLLAMHQIFYLAEAFYPAPLACHVGVIDIGRSSWRTATLVTQASKPVAASISALVLVTADGAMALPDAYRETLERFLLRD